MVPPSTNTARGYTAALAAFGIWGLFPLYLIGLRDVSAMQITAHRIVWSLVFLLGWLGFAAHEDDPELRTLDRKGHDYTEEDKAYLLRAVRRAAGNVLPSWRALAAQGQVELSTSPYYHPIVPLLIEFELSDDQLRELFAYCRSRQITARSCAFRRQAIASAARPTIPADCTCASIGSATASAVTRLSGPRIKARPTSSTAASRPCCSTRRAARRRSLPAGPMS